MDIRNNQQSFTAIKIRPTIIKRLQKEGGRKDVVVNFVKLTKDDYPAVENFSKEIIHSRLVSKIARHFDDKHLNFYAITSQQKKLDKLNPSKILGIVETEQKDKIFRINYLQTGTEEFYTKNKYRHIGQSMIQNLIKQAQKSNSEKISLASLLEARGFYRKLNFKPVNELSTIFELTKNNFEKTLAKP